MLASYVITSLHVVRTFDEYLERLRQAAAELTT